MGLRPCSSFDMKVLRGRFRRLSLLTHPDKNAHADANKCFLRVAEAMRVLGDPVKCNLLYEQVRFQDATSSVPWDFASESGGCHSANTGRASREAPDDAAVKEHMNRRSTLERLAKRRRCEQTASGGVGLGGAATTSGSSTRMEPSARCADAAGSDAEEMASAASQRSQAVALEEDPNLLWQEGGLPFIVQKGWQRLESRRAPGFFYFLHTVTGKTVPHGGQPPSENQAIQQQGGGGVCSLPSGWERRQSRRDPSLTYFVHLASGRTQMQPPI
eukprot:TRINITY_DN36518_c0_g1_i5.p1 TRINITY_DN36518_c0_g1~~TRINITY_DN36518_c0_g1_i5.p1  ORF type:complete len:273 (-),score=61.28 TRINITY_DN36518_c0_g1_i5:537-1355(-)